MLLAEGRIFKEKESCCTDSVTREKESRSERIRQACRIHCDDTEKIQGVVVCKDCSASVQTDETIHRDDSVAL